MLSVDVHKPNSLIRTDYEQRHRFAVALVLKRLLFLVDHFCDWIFSHYSISIFLLVAFFFVCLLLVFFVPFISVVLPLLRCGNTKLVVSSTHRFWLMFFFFVSFVCCHFVKPFIQIMIHSHKLQ